MANTIDLELIDRKIKQLEKLKQLKELLADGDLRELLRETNSNGDSEKARVHRDNPAKPRPEVSETNRRKKGDFGRMVLETATFLPGQVFTVDSVKKALAESGYEFRSANPTIAVGSALRKLAKHGKVQLARQGSGRSPNYYRIT
jgi:hypothetical protein